MDRPEETLPVQQYRTAEEALVFRIPLHVFPGLMGFAYLVLVSANSATYRVLIDTGSGFGESNAQLERGFRDVSQMSGERVGLEDLTHILLTHGHVDHLGGLSFVRERTRALLGVHELDLRNLTNYEERLTMITHRLSAFLIEAGVSPERHQQLIDMYRITKSLYRSVGVDFTYEQAGMQVGPFRMLHVPGHCAGHVVIRLHDILFSGDHVLSEISPHQSPELLTHSTGLDHYLHSLESVRCWARGVRLTLGGHKSPIADLPGRIDEIRMLHRERLERILKLLEEPQTIQELSQELFGEVHGYNVLLALEETGAHVEYLDQRGLIGIDNLQELNGSYASSPIRYRRLPGGMDGRPLGVNVL